MATSKDIARIIAELSAAYPNWKSNEYTAEIYFQDLKDVDSDLLLLAARYCRTNMSRDQRFAPSAGEIRQTAGEIKRQADGVPSALEAWGELLHAPKTEEYKSAGDDNVIEVIPYQWSHPLVRKVAVMMGFPEFPDWERESFERTAFLKAYEVELQNYLKQNDQLPEVTRYIESQKDAQLGMPKEIKRLAKGMDK